MKLNSIRDLAASVKGRRDDLGLSQAELATRVGVSRSWINEVEAGKPSVEFELVLRLLEYLGLRLELSKAASLSDVYKGVNLDSVLGDYRYR